MEDEEKKETWLCPMSFNRDKPLNCREDCAWYFSGFKRCAIVDIACEIGNIMEKM
jgi:hypothetical protein